MQKKYHRTLKEWMDCDLRLGRDEPMRRHDRVESVVMLCKDEREAE